jgi:trigger factor
MQTTLEETDKHTVKLTVEVPPEELGKDLDRAYRKIAQQVKIPGFRKGKVPRQVIDAQVGRDAVVGEFIEDSVPDLLPRGPSRTRPGADQRARHRPGRRRGGQAARVHRGRRGPPAARARGLPVQGVKVDRPAVEVSDQDVDRFLDSLRERFAELETVGRAAREGDYVVIDVHATIHGEEIPGVSRTDHLYELGSGEFGDTLDTEVTGKRAGEILAFNDTLGPGAASARVRRSRSAC